MCYFPMFNIIASRENTILFPLFKIKINRFGQLSSNFEFYNLKKICVQIKIQFNSIVKLKWKKCLRNCPNEFECRNITSQKRQHFGF